MDIFLLLRDVSSTIKLFLDQTHHFSFRSLLNFFLPLSLHIQNTTADTMLVRTILAVIAAAGVAIAAPAVFQES